MRYAWIIGGVIVGQVVFWSFHFGGLAVGLATLVLALVLGLTLAIVTS